MLRTVINIGAGSLIDRAEDPSIDRIVFRDLHSCLLKLNKRINYVALKSRAVKKDEAKLINDLYLERIL
jgi:hypothetical protein